MEATRSQEPLPSRNLSADVDHKSLQQQPNGGRNHKGGWITFPFLAVAMLGLGVARGGATSNFVVYLVKKYNVSRVDAAQIFSIALGCLMSGATIRDTPIVVLRPLLKTQTPDKMTEPTKAHGLLLLQRKGKDSKKPSMRPIRIPLRPARQSPPRSRVADLPSNR